MNPPGRRLRRWARLARVLGDYLDDAADLFDRLELELEPFLPRSAKPVGDVVGIDDPPSDRARN